MRWETSLFGPEIKGWQFNIQKWQLNSQRKPLDVMWEILKGPGHHIPGGSHTPSIQKTSPSGCPHCQPPGNATEQRCCVWEHVPGRPQWAISKKSSISSVPSGSLSTDFRASREKGGNDLEFWWLNHAEISRILMITSDRDRLAWWLNLHN